MTLKSKKKYYFNLIFISGGFAGFLIGRIILNGFTLGLFFTSLGLLITTFGCYYQWKYVIDKLKEPEIKE